jgi:hypothetical protein
MAALPRAEQAKTKEAERSPDCAGEAFVVVPSAHRIDLLEPCPAARGGLMKRWGFPSLYLDRITEYASSD